MKHTTRRKLLAATAAGFGATLTGCLDGEEVPEPVALDAGQACDVCGMIIDGHPGPVGQTFYRDNRPEGRDEDEPAWFCSNTCLFEFYYERSEEGWEPLIHYTTDYSAVDYEVFEDGPSQFITAHPEAEAFADGETTTLVADSDVLGAMGPSLVPFTDPDDAEAFHADYGGEVMSFGDVTRQLIDSL